MHYVSEEQARDIPYQRYLELIKKFQRRNSYYQTAKRARLNNHLSPVKESAAAVAEESAAAAVAESGKLLSGGRRTRKKSVVRRLVVVKNLLT
jgi:hypothetical protein